MKKVLIITYYWPPAGGGGVQRWVKFSKYLESFGWNPVVFTVENGEYPILDDTLSLEVPAELELIKVPIVEPYSLYKKFVGKKKDEKVDPNFLSQGKKLSWKDQIAVWLRGNIFIPDARMWWIIPSVRRLNSYLKANPVDAIISTGPPHTCHVIAYKVATKFKIPWIVDYRDPWTQIDFFEDLKLSKWSKMKHINLERKILNACNAIITVGKTMAEDLSAITTNQNKYVITNGFDEADKPDSSVQLDDDFSIVYIGTMNDARNPLILWQALSELKNQKHPLIDKVNVKLVGKPEVIVSQSIKKFNITELVEFCGYVKHQKAIEFQNAARVLLLIINNTTNNRSILTGKIFEYMATGRPIMCIGPLDGDAAYILKQIDNAKVLQYDDIEGAKQFLVDQFKNFISGKAEQSSNKENIDQYTRRNLTKKLVSILDIISSNSDSN